MTLTKICEDKEYLRQTWFRFIDGDKEAFAVFYNLHIDRLYHYGLKLCNDEDTIKDAVQEIFLDLYIRREKITTTPENLKYYLLLSLKRNLIKKLKNKRRYDHSEEIEWEIINQEFSVEYQIIENEQNVEVRHKIIEALNQLPAKQKEVVYLRFNEAMDYSEIAIMLGITIESVRKQVYRALKTVRELLDIKSITILFHFFQKKQKKSVHI